MVYEVVQVGQNNTVIKQMHCYHIVKVYQVEYNSVFRITPLRSVIDTYNHNRYLQPNAEYKWIFQMLYATK